MRASVRWLSLAVFVPFMALSVGCCSHDAQRHPITVSLGNFAERQAIEVHIIALNDQESPYLEDYSMTKYWSPGDREREGLEKFVMHFGPDSASSQKFSPESNPAEWDKLWKSWEADKATTLFILAFLPGNGQPFDDKHGSLDARRQVLPLEGCRWKSDTQTIECDLTPAKIVINTPPK